MDSPLCQISIYIRMFKRSNSMINLKSYRLSSLSQTVLSCFSLSTILLSLLPPYLTPFALFPLFVIYTHNQKPEFIDYILVVALVAIQLGVYMTVMMLGLLIPLTGKYILLSAYIPVIFVAIYYRYTGEMSNFIEFTERLIWDGPVMLWMYLVSLFGGRVMKVCPYHLISPHRI